MAAGIQILAGSFAAAGGASGYSLVEHLEYSPNAGSATTGSINTTGANMIVAVVSAYSGWAPTGFSDSKGNIYTASTLYTDASAIRFYYCIGATAGTGHTFTAAVTPTNYTFIGVMAFSAPPTAAFHSVNGRNANSGLTTGSITPSVDGSLIVAAIGNYAVGGVPTINSGFTGYGVAKSGDIGMGGIAYLVQETAGSVNPEWTSTGTAGSPNCALSIIAFSP